MELPLFASLDRRSRRELQANLSEVTRARGDVIADAGAADRDLLILAEGVVKLCMALPDGRQQIVAFRTKGQLLTLPRGEAPWPVTATAVTACRLYRVGRRARRRLSLRYPQIDRRLLELANDEIAALYQHLLYLGRMTTEEKVASFLLDFGKASLGSQPALWALSLPMRRPEIADYLGLTTESICREFSRLKQEKIIGLPRPSQVILLDRPALEAITQGRAAVNGTPLPSRHGTAGAGHGDAGQTAWLKVV